MPPAMAQEALQRAVRVFGGPTVEARTTGRAGGGGRIIRGLACPFNQWATVKTSEAGVELDIVRPGAFTATIREGRDVMACIAHDRNRYLGSTWDNSLRLHETARGLEMTLSVPDTRDGDEAVRMAAWRGCGLSIAYRRGGPRGGKRVRISYDDRGRRVTRTELLDLVLVEISVVVSPAYAGAWCEVAEADSHAPLRESFRTYLNSHEVTS
jgi:HK97 family phage prohead protease